ncbi:MAG: hypothetical protein KIT20_13250 [Alphaproteobacteria bacterium]|nr:hypothetical protein [Alphaproteobacteria bacterium]
MPIKTIRLELARTPEHPMGSSEYGYEFRAPLTPEGHIDADAFRDLRKECRVRRFWKGEPDRLGELHHTRHREWAFSYEPGEEDDEPFFRLDAHVFRPGEYVTIREGDGTALTFKVTQVR